VATVLGAKECRWLGTRVDHAGVTRGFHCTDGHGHHLLVRDALVGMLPGVARVIAAPQPLIESAAIDLLRAQWVHRHAHWLAAHPTITPSSKGLFQQPFALYPMSAVSCWDAYFEDITMNHGLSAVAFGLAASLSWGTGDFSGGLATRRASVFSIVAAAHATGLVLLVALAVLWSEPLPSALDLVWGGTAGLVGAVGLASF